jgi:hypothetical protein
MNEAIAAQKLVILPIGCTEQHVHHGDTEERRRRLPSQRLSPCAFLRVLRVSVVKNP